MPTYWATAHPKNQWTPCHLRQASQKDLTQPWLASHVSAHESGDLAAAKAGEFEPLGQVFRKGLLKVHVANEPSGQWLEDSIRFSVGEVDGSNAGSGLAGARDPIIGQALALLHKEPAHPWTISNLARRIGLSRTRLAERFRHFLGEFPMAYLAQWRLKLGAEILQPTEDSVAEVAAAVGYGSEAAFNRAFKREFDCPPAQFRGNCKAPPAQHSQESRRHG